MLLMIDNYDSFTYNLVQYPGELGAEAAGEATQARLAVEGREARSGDDGRQPTCFN